jgi:formate hydrogenlyase subunit 3/multisubunit Na+/H+ antiporter MnhD subunit
MSLGLLLIVAFGGSLLTYLLGKVSSRIRDAFAVLISLALVVMVASLYGKALRVPFYEGFLGMSLVLRVDGLSWLFAIAASVLGCLSIVFSLGYMKGKERTSLYYSMLLLVNAAMLGVVLSGDLLSLFIFWEIMSWSTFLLISYNGGPALAAGMKYFVMSFVGSLAMLAGVLTLHGSFGTLEGRWSSPELPPGCPRRPPAMFSPSWSSSAWPSGRRTRSGRSTRGCRPRTRRRPHRSAPCSQAYSSRWVSTGSSSSCS